uniref:Uncharacterized protein n=1 Tax=viral metagenome TaxID=1070528 RepID=A0A6C0KNM2_9ZZZZ
MSVYHIVYVSCVSGVFTIVMGMCICSLYRHIVYIPRQNYENGGVVEVSEYDSNDDEDEVDMKVISENL